MAPWIAERPSDYHHGMDHRKTPPPAADDSRAWPPDAGVATTAACTDAPAAAELFPPIEPFAQGVLAVGDGHALYHEQCGNPTGMAVLVLHGGPGSGCSPHQRRLLDPALFHVVLFDQRGCGRSTPRGAIAANTTADLVADIERLRRRLGIERWLVFAGSWGASLALAYCAQHPQACLGALLRGIFLTGRADIDWFFRGAGELVPDAWARFAHGLSPAEHDRIAAHYLGAVSAPDDAAAAEAVLRWMEWEAALSAPGSAPPALALPDAEARRAALAKYRIQAHYLAHECFIGEEAALQFAAAMAGVPTAILHGRLDLVCRPANALKLHRALPGSRIRFVAGAGHNPFDPPMAHALIGAAHHFHTHGDFAAWGDDLRAAASASDCSPPPAS